MSKRVANLFKDIDREKAGGNKDPKTDIKEAIYNFKSKHGECLRIITQFNNQ